MPTVANALLAMSPDEDNAVRLRASALWELGLRQEATALAQTVQRETSPEWLTALNRNSVVANLDVGELAQLVLAGDLLISSGALLSEIALLLDGNGHTLEALLLHHQATVLAPTDEDIRNRRGEALEQLRFSLDLDAQMTLIEDEGRYMPIRERTLILSPESRPYVDSHVADWAHETAVAQRAQGLDANVVTLLPHPWNIKPPKVPLKTIIDDISYYRLLPGGPFPDGIDAMLRMNLEALKPLVLRLKPGVLHAAAGFIPNYLASVVGRAFGLAVVFELMEPEART